MNSYILLSKNTQHNLLGIFGQFQLNYLDQFQSTICLNT